MLRVELIGNLVRDPEARVFDGGSQVVNFTVAVNHGKDRDQVMFVGVSVWGAMGEACLKYLGKGKKVYVSGAPAVRAWTGRDGSPRAEMTVTAREVEFLTPKGSENQVPEGYIPVDEEPPF